MQCASAKPSSWSPTACGSTLHGVRGVCATRANKNLCSRWSRRSSVCALLRLLARVDALQQYNYTRRYPAWGTGTLVVFIGNIPCTTYHRKYHRMYHRRLQPVLSLSPDSVRTQSKITVFFSLYIYIYRESTCIFIHEKIKMRKKRYFGRTFDGTFDGIYVRGTWYIP